MVPEFRCDSPRCHNHDFVEVALDMRQTCEKAAISEMEIVYKLDLRAPVIKSSPSRFTSTFSDDFLVLDKTLFLNGESLFDGLLTLEAALSPVEGYNRFLRNQENKGRENNTRTIAVETPTQNALIAQDGIGGYDWSYQAEEEQPTNHALMAFTSSGSSSSSDSEVDSCSKTCVKAYATLKEQYDSLSSDYKKSQFNLVSYKAGLESVEARLAHYKKNEVVFEESINVFKLEVRLRDNALNEYKMNLENAEKERDQLKQTLEKFQNSSKSLNNILKSQVIDKFKTGSGYNATTTASPAVESFVNLTDMSGSDKGYHSVPPPLTGNFIPHKPDLTFVNEIVKSENLDVTTIVTPSNAKTVENKGVSNTVESNAVRINNTSAPIIEDWNSDDESEIDYTVRPSTEKIKSVKTVRETDAPKQNKQHPRGNQRNWNNLTSQRLGSCKASVEQLKKGKLSTASAAVNTVRPVNTTNTKAVNTVRSVNTAASKPIVNHPRTKTNAFKRGCSRPVKRHFANKNSIINSNVNTARVKHTTARDRTLGEEKKTLCSIKSSRKEEQATN
ncbi:hypothetical protein Tco_0072721 [Tanacetum coccineum]